MPSCPACTTRLLRIFVHDTATRSLLLPAVNPACRRPFPHQAYTQRIPTTRPYSTATSSTTSNSSSPTITRVPSASQHTRKYEGPAYSQKHLSDDDYMPFITELPPPLLPPPLGRLPMMSGMPPGVPRAMKEELGVGVQEGLEAEWRWEQERELQGERERREEDIRSTRGGGRIRPGRERVWRAIRKIEELDEIDADVEEELEQIGEVYVGENLEQMGESEQQMDEVAEIEMRPEGGQREEGLVQATPELTAAIEEKPQAEEQPVRSRKENRLARKERRKLKKLQELQALGGGEGTQGITKGALHIAQRELKTRELKADVEAQVKAQVMKKMEQLALDPATPPPLLPVRGTLPTPAEKVEPASTQNVQSQTGSRKRNKDLEAGVESQVSNKMEELGLDPAALFLYTPVRGTLPPSSESVNLAKATKTPKKNKEKLKTNEKTHLEPEPPRPKYKGTWALPTFEPPTPPGPKNKDIAIPQFLKSLVGTKPTPESILRNPKSHSAWVVQKAALQKKFNGTPWQAHKRISPGMVCLIQAINAEAPHKLRASEIAAKFKISPEAARRILGSKRVWSDEEKERKARKWIERGEMIRQAKIENGEIWTKEKRRNVYQVKEKWRKIREMNDEFGIKVGVGKEGEGVEVERSLGRISWEGKFV